MAIWDGPLKSYEETFTVASDIQPNDLRHRIRQVLKQFSWPAVETESGFSATRPPDIKRMQGENIEISIHINQIKISSSGRNSNTVFGGIDKINAENVSSLKTAILSATSTSYKISTIDFINSMTNHYNMYKMEIINESEYISEKQILINKINDKSIDCDPIDFLGNISELVSLFIISTDELTKIKSSIFNL